MSREAESSPGFTGNPLVSMPRARDSGDPEFTSHNGGSDAAFRLHNGVGNRNEEKISELLIRARMEPFHSRRNGASGFAA